jgi:futalosine hydrolase
MHTGIGKVNAAHSAAGIIERYAVAGIINFGIAGAYPGSGLGIGDIAVATEEHFGDEGILGPQGWSGMEEIGIPLVHAGRKKYFNRFPLDRGLAEKARGAASLFARESAPGFKVRTGGFVTVSSVSGSRKRSLELEQRFQALCENMEGAAIAQVCTMYKVPLIEARGISNIAGIRDKRTWNVARASGNCQRVVLETLRSL